MGTEPADFVSFIEVVRIFQHSKNLKLFSDAEVTESGAWGVGVGSFAYFPLDGWFGVESVFPHTSGQSCCASFASRRKALFVPGVTRLEVFFCATYVFTGAAGCF